MSDSSSATTAYSTESQKLIWNLMSDPKNRQIIQNILCNKPLPSTPVKSKTEQKKFQSPSGLQRHRQLAAMKNNTINKEANKQLQCKSLFELYKHIPEVPYQQILDGVVAFVDIRTKEGNCSKPVEILMKTMGAKVVDKLTKEVTHVIYKDGSLVTFQRANLLKVHFLTPMWLQALRTLKRRVPEKDYPALSIYSDDSIYCNKIQTEFEKTSPKAGKTSEDTSDSSEDSLIPSSMEPNGDVEKLKNDPICETYGEENNKKEESCEITKNNFNLRISDSQHQSDCIQNFTPEKSADKFKEPDIPKTKSSLTASSSTDRKSERKSSDVIAINIDETFLNANDSNNKPNYNDSSETCSNLNSTNNSSMSPLKLGDSANSGAGSFNLKLSTSSNKSDQNKTAFPKSFLSKTNIRKLYSENNYFNEIEIKATPNADKHYSSSSDSEALSTLQHSDMPVNISYLSKINKSVKLNFDKSNHISNTLSPINLIGCSSKTKPSLLLNKKLKLRVGEIKKNLKKSKQNVTRREKSKISSKASVIEQPNSGEKCNEPINTVKRKPGRPSKVVKINIDNNESIEINDSNNKTSFLNTQKQQELSLQRKAHQSNNLKQTESDRSTVKRKPGRPPKISKENSTITLNKANINLNESSEPKTVYENLNILNRTSDKTTKVFKETTSEESIELIELSSSDSTDSELATKPVETTNVSTELDNLKTDFDKGIVKRKRGRPPKICKRSIVNIELNKKGTDSSSCSELELSSTTSELSTDSKDVKPLRFIVRRKSGRPSISPRRNCHEENTKRNKTTTTMVSNETSDTTSSVYIKRKPGRPPKISTKSPTVITSKEANFNSDQSRELEKANESINLIKRNSDRLSNLRKKRTHHESTEFVELNNSSFMSSQSIDSKDNEPTSKIIQTKAQPNDKKKEVNISVNPGKIFNDDKDNRILRVRLSDILKKPTISSKYIVSKRNKKTKYINDEVQATKSNLFDKSLTTNTEYLNDVSTLENNKRKYEKDVRDNKKKAKNIDEIKTNTNSTIAKRRKSIRILNTKVENKYRRSSLDFVKPTQKVSKNIKSSSKKNFGIVCTRFRRPQVEAFKNIVSKLGKFEFEYKVTKNTTHLVAQKPKYRTVNTMKAIARGCWILDKEWVDNSLKAGKWLPEEDFELYESFPAVRKCRMQKAIFGSDFCMDIFKDIGLIYVHHDTKPPCKDLQDLIELCGGSVAKTLSRRVAYSIGYKYENTTDSNVKSLTENWILDSIQSYKRKPIKSYLMLM